MPLLPSRRLLLRQRLEKLRADGDNSTQRPKPALARRRSEWHQLGDRLISPRQNNFLAGLDTRQKLRQGRLRGLNRNGFHGERLG
jgi:hypothetical protein